MSYIAVNTDLVTYASKYMLASDDNDQVNYISQRIAESVPDMQRTLTIWLKQDIEDYLKANDPGYLKLSPIRRLLEVLDSHLKEFV